MKDGKFAWTLANGSLYSYGSYTVLDNQTLGMNTTENGKSGKGTYQVSITDDDHITITGKNEGTPLIFTRLSHDK